MPIPKALEQVGGLQTQYAPSGYVGLWSRLHQFERGALTRELESRRVVQATLMRVTIHIVSAGDYPLLAAAVRRARRENYLRVFKTDPVAVEHAAERVRGLLAGGPRTRVELQKALGVDNQVWYGVGLWVDLVRVPPSGTWERRRADLLLTAEQWLGPSTASEEAGMDRLVQRYLSGFGPARAKEIANWGGVALGSVMAALGRIRVVRYADEQGIELFDLPDAPLPDPDSAAPVRFLPTWDATLLAHARQAQLLAEEHRPRVFDIKTPHSVGTFMVDGVVAGTWRPGKGRVVTEAFAPLKASANKWVDEEAARLAAFHA